MSEDFKNQSLNNMSLDSTSPKYEREHSQSLALPGLNGGTRRTSFMKDIQSSIKGSLFNSNTP